MGQAQTLPAGGQPSQEAPLFLQYAIPMDGVTDAYPAIAAAIAGIKNGVIRERKLVLPRNGNGGYKMSQGIAIDFSYIHLHFEDNVTGTYTTKQSLFSFVGTFSTVDSSSMLRGIKVTGLPGVVLDGNGSNITGYTYSTSDTYYSALFFQYCYNPIVEDLILTNGLVNTGRTFGCDLPVFNRCTFLSATWDNGASIDFNPPYHTPGRPDRTSTVTFTAASPCVMTWSGSSFSSGRGVSFISDGKLLDGLSKATVYYLKALTSSTYELALTPGGASINTSGTQNGTHTGATGTACAGKYIECFAYYNFCFGMTFFASSDCEAVNCRAEYNGNITSADDGPGGGFSMEKNTVNGLIYDYKARFINCHGDNNIGKGLFITGTGGYVDKNCTFNNNYYPDNPAIADTAGLQGNGISMVSVSNWVIEAEAKGNKYYGYRYLGASSVFGLGMVFNSPACTSNGYSGINVQGISELTINSPRCYKNIENGALSGIDCSNIASYNAGSGTLKVFGGDSSNSGGGALLVDGFATAIVNGISGNSNNAVTGGAAVLMKNCTAAYAQDILMTGSGQQRAVQIAATCTTGSIESCGGTGSVEILSNLATSPINANGFVITVGDADKTATTGRDLTIEYNTPITANRTVTLNTKPSVGDKITLIRTTACTGAFTVSLGSVGKTYYAGQKVKAQFDGTNWIQIDRQENLITTLHQGGIPLILQSSGTMGNNGALSAITSQQIQYTSCYMYFPVNTIAAGVAAGWYYAVMSSTTTATIYNNTYTSGTPTIPTSPTAFATTGPGAYTQTTAEITALSIPVVAGSMGINGRIKAWLLELTNNNANNKTFKTKFGSTTFTNWSAVSTLEVHNIPSIQNAGATNTQLFIGSTSAATGIPSNTTGVAVATAAEDTTTTLNLTITMQLATATDTMGIASADFELKTV